MIIDNLFDFMDALRKQETPDEFIDSDGIGDALEEICEAWCKARGQKGSRYYYNHGYRLGMDLITVYYEESHCSCCNNEDGSDTVGYQELWDHLIANNAVVEID